MPTAAADAQGDGVKSVGLPHGTKGFAGAATAGGGVNLNDPIDSPFFSDPSEAEPTGIPTEYVRRMEEAQRMVQQLNMQQEVFDKAHRDSVMTIGVQCMWLMASSYVVQRGMYYSDPYYSILRGFTEHRLLRRVTTPLSCLGLGMMAITMWQLPTDISIYNQSQVARKMVDVEKQAALQARQQALLEGTRIAKGHPAVTVDPGLPR